MSLHKRRQSLLAKMVQYGLIAGGLFVLGSKPQGKPLTRKRPNGPLLATFVWRHLAPV